MAIAVTWGKKMANIEPAVPLIKDTIRKVDYRYLCFRFSPWGSDDFYSTLEDAQASKPGVFWEQRDEDKWHGKNAEGFGYSIIRCEVSDEASYIVLD
ncbi:MAG: hypothetical protein KGL39_05815 [Patescibacteria group bacterium]|nr:hypothetical protein [Patescibacteria group bacterium]